MKPSNKFEPSKPATWSCELILDPKNQEHMAFMQRAEQHFVDEHGDNAKRSSHWLSIAKDKEDQRKPAPSSRSLASSART